MNQSSGPSARTVYALSRSSGVSVSRPTQVARRNIQNTVPA